MNYSISLNYFNVIDSFLHYFFIFYANYFLKDLQKKDLVI